MPITVHSPFSGYPVKIRDQDVGRAVRDEENRIFYVVQRADGSGFYGAPTRAGNPRDEQRYDELVAKMAQAKASGQAQSTAQVHDARGKARTGMKGWLVVLVLIILIGAAAYMFFSGELDRWMGRTTSDTPAGQTVPQTPLSPGVPAGPDVLDEPRSPDTPAVPASPPASPTSWLPAIRIDAMSPGQAA